MEIQATNPSISHMQRIARKAYTNPFGSIQTTQERTRNAAEVANAASQGENIMDDNRIKGMPDYQSGGGRYRNIVRVSMGEIEKNIESLRKQNPGTGVFINMIV